jgi:sialic acid synthase SpsE
MESIKIGKKQIGSFNNNCYIIAEIGSNFDGNLLQAKKLIKLAKKCGADAAKFQSFITEELIEPEGFKKKKSFQAKWQKNVVDVYKNAELPRKWHSILSTYAKKIGIDFFSSPWDFEAVDLLDKLNVPAFKIGSGDITYIEILKHVGRKNKPIFLATGSSTLKEVENAIKAIKSTGNSKIVLMHSVVNYPSKIEDANLKVLKTLNKKFNLPVGYSDHSPGILVAMASVALGGCVIEKHFTINKKSKGPDHPHSMEPQEFSELVTNVRMLEKALGNGEKKIVNDEKATKKIQRRGIWTSRKICKGEKFSKDNIKALRPYIEISASEYGRLINKKSKRTINSHKPIIKKDFKD